MFLTLGIVAVVAVLVFTGIVALLLRRVVATNEVHVVQSAKRTTVFGKDSANGNTYYEWPSWIPVIGINTIVLPVSVFDLELNAYEAYDVGRVPFVVDIRAFFRIADAAMAAEKVETVAGLKEQLEAIVQGAARKILASNEIEEILQGRGKFGDEFTTEVQGQLKAWGVETVKNIELMDIRDSRDSKVISNIMDKKKSLIEMQSRTEVAENLRKAEMAEIEATREINIQAQQAEQAVGERTAQKVQAVGIANEQAQQEIKEQQRITKEKEMAVVKVQEVKQAEITKDVHVVKAEEDKQTSVIKAEGQKEQTIKIAQGNLEAKKMESQGIAVEGQAKADAEKAMQLAPVEAQIVLAKEIGGNEGYQKYLITIRQVEAQQTVGVEQAKALEKADVKIISNAGNPTEGATSVMNMFTPNGGTQLAGMVEAFAQSEQGAAILSKLTTTKKTTK